ncbi:MAG TPA: citrate synthase [Nitriliruptorales bacterium]|nr:citrate synthase [Nitriliruptorales bacterium]
MADESKDTLTVTDNRTGRTYEFEIVDGAVQAMDLRQIKVSDHDFGLLSYDPGLRNTATCRSTVTYIDGDRGVLLYRGYPIEQLAEHSSFLEVAYLLIHGDLPDQQQHEEWIYEITHHTMIHESIKKFIDGFHHDAHPMGILVGTVGGLSTFYPEAKKIHDPDNRHKQLVRLIAKFPTLAAFAYRHSIGLRYAYPDNDLSFPGNFLNMMWKKTELKYEPDPVLERAVDVLFILHADHEQNCSTTTMRTVGSSDADPYSSAAAAVAALYGPKHGGANEQVLRMLEEIGTADQVPKYVERVKHGEFRLMGFGHRIYKNYDPRAKVIRQIAHDVFAATGKNPLIDVAVALEETALEDEYFTERRLYPNVDFYSGIIYQALGFPTDMFPVLFACARIAGWCAQWQESLLDNEQAIARPRQVYVGPPERRYVPLGERG